jgi:Rod binding domain-containing protein
MTEINNIASNALAQLSAAQSGSATKLAQQLGAETDSQKIDRSAKQFETILLASWLQQAEKSFATVPGGDEDEDSDPGKGQFQGYAMQAVATALTNAGGIGIAPMLSKALTKQNLESKARARAAVEGLGATPESK